MNIEDRFLAQCSPEPNTGCWLWTGAIDAHGYGRFFAVGYDTKAHRTAHRLFKGPIPVIEGAKRHGTCVLHICDVRTCVNPDHLYAGTQTQNMRDLDTRSRRRTAPPGTNHNIKLTPQDIPQIRRLHKDGKSFGSIGRRFGVDHKTIQHIIFGRSWRHVP